jgi:hypothetical protein
MIGAAAKGDCDVAVPSDGFSEDFCGTETVLAVGAGGSFAGGMIGVIIHPLGPLAAPLTPDVLLRHSRPSRLHSTGRIPLGQRCEVGYGSG